MSNQEQFQKFLMKSVILAILLLGEWPASAQTLEVGPNGYIAHLADGQSLYDAAGAIQDARSGAGGAPTIEDRIVLAEGTFQFTDAQGLHLDPSTSSSPPLRITGAGMSRTVLMCPSNRYSVCAYSAASLTFEDLRLVWQPASPEQGLPLLLISGNMKLQRVAWESDSQVGGIFYFGMVQLDGGVLSIEDSVIQGNKALSEGTLFFAPEIRVERSTFSGNTGPSLFKFSQGTPGGSMDQSTVVGNGLGTIFSGNSASTSQRVSITRSIVEGNLGNQVDLTISNSFTGSDPMLENDGSGFLVPQPGSPVVDQLPCNSRPTDGRGKPTGVHASYLTARGIDCDYGAVEAQHRFCMATDHDTVACDEGEIDQTEVAALGCRIFGGLLDCSGGKDADVSTLGFGDLVKAGDAVLAMQLDGNLVLYDNNIPLWATATNVGSCMGHSASLVGDLNVTSDPQGPGGAQVCWSFPGNVYHSTLREGFAGNPARVIAENANGSAFWMTENDLPPGQSFAPYGTRFRIGSSLQIPGAFAVHQGDGNFVLYDMVEGVLTPLWATGTYGICAGEEAVFQGDGNLVIGRPGTECLFGINPGPGGTVLRLHRDDPAARAKLSVYNATGQIIWQTP